MGTVLRVGRFRFGFYSNEPVHEPPHVHVFAAGAEVKLWLSDPITVAGVHGMADHDIRDAQRICAEHRAALLQAYDER